MRCTCNQEVIRELEELAARIDSGNPSFVDGKRYKLPLRADEIVSLVRDAITRRRASMQPVRYQETER
jgi:hypothetical protein